VFDDEDPTKTKELKASKTESPPLFEGGSIK